MLNLRLKREDLLRGVSQTQSIAEKRSSMPILSNVLLEVEAGRLAITATDLEVSFKGTYEAEILGEGRLTVPARKFYEIVRVLSDEEFILKEGENYNLELTGLRSQYQLHGLPPEDFPLLPDYGELEFLEIESGLLLDMIEKTVYSISVEETRYNLAGVFFETSEQESKEKLRMVSTDGHRLSLVEKEIPGIKALGLKKGVIVSRKGITEMRKLAEAGGQLKLGFASNNAVIQAENAVLVMRLLDGRFPDYTLVIPKKNTKIMKAGRKEFIEVLRRVSVMSSDEYKGVKFSLAPKELKLIAVNPDLGEARESLPVEYDGDELEVGFNPRYFVEALSSLKSDLVNAAFLDSGNPCQVTAAEDAGYIGVIMPMKI
ncbi:MAG: DNA polymerase III subunit beta [Pseudomonadota bacterium]